MHPDISQSAAAMPVAATVVVISAVPVAAAVADCQRPGAAAVADCLCSSGSGGDACGGDGGGDSGGACGCGCGELQIAGEAAADGCGGGDAAWRRGPYAHRQRCRGRRWRWRYASAPYSSRSSCAQIKPGSTEIQTR